MSGDVPTIQHWVSSTFTTTCDACAALTDRVNALEALVKRLIEDKARLGAEINRVVRQNAARNGKPPRP